MAIFGNNSTNQIGSTNSATNTATKDAIGTVTKGTTAYTPYKGVQPAINTGLSNLLSLYRSGSLNPYVKPGGLTTMGQDALIDKGFQGAGSLQNALATFSNFGAGGGNIGTAAQSGIGKMALQPSFAQKYLGDVASGAYLDRADPNFERVLGRATEQADTAARMAAGARGRYGGDFAQTEVGRTVGDLQANARMNQYNTERQRQVEATGMLDAAKQAGLAQSLNAYNSQSSIQAANKDRQLGAAGAVPGAFSASLLPYQIQMEVGAQRDADALKKAQAPSQNLASLLQAIQMFQPYGTQTQNGTQNVNSSGTQIGVSSGTSNGTTEGPDNTLAQGLGLGIGGMSLLNQIKQAGGLSNLLTGWL